MLTRLASRRKGRSGITLTEILISIMILGIGIISLATLFPLGLIRLRNAQRLSRGAYLVQSASSDLASRNLLARLSFINPRISPWYASTGLPPASRRYDPWVQDTPSYGGNWGTVDNTTGLTTGFLGVHRGYGANGEPNWRVDTATAAAPGLPVAYDPLWRAVVGEYPDPGTFATGEARFGSGIGFLRQDPHGGPVGTTPSAYGLQRVTNFCTYTIPGLVPAVAANANYSRVVGTFVSPEDMVLQESTGKYTDTMQGGQLATPSPVVPALTIDPSINPGGPDAPSSTFASTLANGVVLYPSQNDWRFSWMFTGRRSDATDGATFDGDIVIHENRQFGLDVTNTPFPPSSLRQPAGETVVEAVWGYSASAGTTIGTSGIGYGNLSASRLVLLRWPATVADPEVRVGSWIADVTYERSELESIARSHLGNPVNNVRFDSAVQRCHWYQVAKKTEATPGMAFNGDPANTPYREMTVWVSTTLRARTPLDFNSSPASPYHVEAALVAPTVVNVYPWSGIIR